MAAMAGGVRGLVLRAGVLVAAAGVVLLLLLVWEARAAHADARSDRSSESAVDEPPAALSLGGADPASGISVQTAPVARRPATPAPPGPTSSPKSTGDEATKSPAPPVLKAPSDASSSPNGEKTPTINVPRAAGQLPGPTGNATSPHDVSSLQPSSRSDTASPRANDSRVVAVRVSPVAELPSRPRTAATAKDHPVLTSPETGVTNIPVLDTPRAPNAPDPIRAAMHAGSGSTSDLAPAPASDSQPVAAVLVAAMIVLVLAGRRRIARARFRLPAPVPIPLIRPG